MNVKKILKSHFILSETDRVIILIKPATFFVFTHNNFTSVCPRKRWNFSASSD